MKAVFFIAEQTIQTAAIISWLLLLALQPVLVLPLGWLPQRKLARLALQQ